MKIAKKLFALTLALIMVMALGVSAFAATITISNNNTEGNVGGETYTAYKVFDASAAEGDASFSYTISTNSPFYAAVEASGYFDLAATANDSTVMIVEAGANFDDNAAKTLAASLNAVEAKGDPAKTWVGTEAAELGEGYYLITDSLGTALILDTVGKTKVEITTKNDYPTLDKTITGAGEDGTVAVGGKSATANDGATITFALTVGIPATVDADEPVVIHDEMSENLTGLAVTSDNATLNADGTITVDKAAVETNRGGSVVVTCTATFNANGSGEATNNAWLTYSSYTTPKSEVEVSTHKFDVYKWTGTVENGLAGAGFVLQNADGDYYNINDNGVVTWVEEAAATELTTSADNDYTVTFQGLADGEYTLIEKTTPAGYNTLKKNVTVTIAGADLTGDNQITVENQSGTELPSTGGIGTTIFYVVGGILVAAAVVLLITKKRVAGEN